MKKFFDSFYIFSKFSLSFILLFCVFFLIYILYINYKNEDQISNFQLELENELRTNINKNSELIQNISNEILETQKTLTNIEKIIKENSNKKMEVDLTAINESIDLLNKNFNILNSDISSLKNKKIDNQSNNTQLINQSVSEVVELIKLKYENSRNFDKEFKYLEKILEKDKIPLLEKLSILKNNKYKGHIFLENKFKIELDLYLKKMINRNNNFINKIFLPYINLSPTSENTIVDDKVLLLEEINFYIKNRKIDEAYISIRKIEGYEDFFQISLNEMKNYTSFIKEISKIK